VASITNCFYFFLFPLDSSFHSSIPVVHAVVLYSFLRVQANSVYPISMSASRIASLSQYAIAPAFSSSQRVIFNSIPHREATGLCVPPQHVTLSNLKPLTWKCPSKNLEIHFCCPSYPRHSHPSRHSPSIDPSISIFLATCAYRSCFRRVSSRSAIDQSLLSYVVSR
jgi:hypothetical protein